MTVDRGWIALLLTRDLATFSRELELFRDESLVWRTAPGVSNSAGNLALHVCGNLQHFVGAVLGGTGYVRDREREFSVRDVPRADLLNEIEATTGIVRTVVPQIPEPAFTAGYPDVLGGIRPPTGLFLLHLCTHLAHHLGQAGYLRRILTEESVSAGGASLQVLSARP